MTLDESRQITNRERTDMSEHTGRKKPDNFFWPGEYEHWPGDYEHCGYQHYGYRHCVISERNDKWPESRSRGSERRAGESQVVEDRAVYLGLSEGVHEVSPYMALTDFVDCVLSNVEKGKV